MLKTKLTLAGREIPVIALDTLVIGTGCAGYNAADWLYDLGRKDIAILTEGVNIGTSRNTGSDKQTYYKLSIASDGADSVQEMAETLFSGGSVHGDTALAEAAGSLRAFMKLANLGVPFPTNEYGEYVGYKTDHDPRQRATSAGPLTSRFMTEALERSVSRKGIRIFDRMQAVRLLTEDGAVKGLLALDLRSRGPAGLTLFAAEHIILATGGPAAVYAQTVYPYGHIGGSGLAIEAGAAMTNLQEWQYGLASIDFRWNVSGTYQQVLPRYISVDEHGTEREFLPDYFESPEQALDMVFLKGYQWPFDVRKTEGSSVIDLIIHHETVELGRKVYMDFRTDPKGLRADFSGLAEETRTYLANSGALLATPIARLAHMNPDAIALYQSHGIDLYKEPLRVAVCAQHANGGVSVDANWQTTVRGLYAAGECAGTFGVYRPGGSALNSTQVGSMRAAEHIAMTSDEIPFDEARFAQTAAKLEPWLQKMLETTARAQASSKSYQILGKMQQHMSACAAHLRRPQAMQALQHELEDTLAALPETYIPAAEGGFAQMLRIRDTLMTQAAVLSAMRYSAEAFGSRGAGLVLHEAGEPVCAALPELRCLPSTHPGGGSVVVTEWTEGGVHSRREDVRSMPVRNGWFETVWHDYRERMRRIR